MKTLFHVVVFVLLMFRCIVGDVSCNVRKRGNPDRAMYINQNYSAIKVESEQLSEHHIMLLWQKGTHELPGKLASGANVLSAQSVFLFSSDFSLNIHQFWRHRIVVIAFV